jgi:sec-independent protein translocase protein TatA
MPTSLGPAEILVILVVALIVLGPKRLPEAARQVGKTLAEVRKWSQGFQDEVRSVIDPDVAPPYYPSEPAPTPTPAPTLPAETGPPPAEAPAPAAANGSGPPATNGRVAGRAPLLPSTTDRAGSPVGEPPPT